MPLTGALPGNPGYWLDQCDISAYGGVMSFAVKARTDTPAGYWIFIADDSYKLAYLDPAAPATVNVPYDPTRTTHAAGVVSAGPWSYIPAGYDPRGDLALYAGNAAATPVLTWPAVVVALGSYGDAGQLTAWNLDGLARFRNCGTSRLGVFSRLRLDLTTNAGVHALTLYAGDPSQPVCSGSRTGNGTIALTSVNGSGLSGNCSLAYGGDIAFGNAAVEAEFGSYYTVKESGATLGIVNDDGVSNSARYVVTGLSAGNHSLIVTTTDSRGNESNNSIPVTFTFYGRPAAPSSLAYANGGAAAPVVTFTPSTTNGATYAGYIQPIGGLLDLDTPACTAAAGATQITLPAVVGYPGQTRLLLRAVYAGLDDGRANVLDLNWDAYGNFVPVAPAIPICKATATVHRTLYVAVSYNGYQSAAVATTAQLFLVADGGVPDWTSPSATIALPATGPDGVAFVTLSAPAPADGWYRWAVRIATVAGTQSPNTALSGPIWLGTAAMPAPTPRADYQEA